MDPRLLENRMNTNKKGCFFALLSTLSLLPFSSHAGVDPISWQLNKQFQNPLTIGSSDSVTYTLTNQLPFPLVKPLVISKNTNSPNEFSYADNCTGVRLASKASCTVTASLTPTSSGIKQLQVVIGGYDHNQVPLPLIGTETPPAPTPPPPPPPPSTKNVTGKVTQSLPYQMSIGSSATYTFVFTNNGQTTATDLNVSVVQPYGIANIVTNTCTGTLAAGTSCTITGSYIPSSTTPSTQSITATLSYQGSSANSVSETTTTQVNASSSVLASSFVVPNYLPPLVLAGTPYKIQVLFTNVSGSTLTLSPPGNISCTHLVAGDCNAALSNFSSSCGASLPATNPAAACQLEATFTVPSSPAPTPGSTYTITASVGYTGGTGSPSTIATTGTFVSSLPTTRTITLVNQCTFPVWFSLNGSAVANVSCNAQGVGCPTGTSCNTSTLLCYWNNPGPNTGTSYQLTATGSTSQNTVTIPANNYGGIQWSGNISASTGCSGSSCAQASCNNNGGTTSCAPGKGFSQPATQAEITMSAASNDSYDVEVINGFHIPISMTPYYYASTPATAENYNCGAPGSSSTTNNFGACNWSNASLPAPSGGTGFSSGYYWVTNGGSPCNINTGASQCSSGQLCGLAQDPSTNAFSQVCGNFLGYWSADQVCSNTGLSSTVSNFFNCSMSLPTSSPSFPANATLYNLMACQVPTGDVSPLYNSCYLSYPGQNPSQIATCCGCVDWWNSSETSGVTIQSNPTTQSCGTQVDPIWTQYIQPMVQWMKASCPSAYVYPFDDKTSGFTCTNNLPNQPNSTDYTITFCEGGNTGLPSGITEGRG